jgi:hypothetical protein
MRRVWIKKASEPALLWRPKGIHTTVGARLCGKYDSIVIAAVILADATIDDGGEIDCSF